LGVFVSMVMYDKLIRTVHVSQKLSVEISKENAIL